MLKEHDIAPDFTRPDQDGTEHTLTEYRGRYVLLYFYPKNDTPGCTKEACVIRDTYGEFEHNDIKVIGMNADSVESHKAFATKYNLPFTLLSDPDKEVITAYGAKGPINIKRISYLITPDGSIAKVYPDVDPGTHGIQVLKDVIELFKK